jgi:hypothetical protein
MRLQRFWKYRGLMVIVLWQAAPQITRTESGGRVQYGLGYGEGRIDDVFFTGGCETGEPSVEHVVTHRPKSVGASVSYWDSRRVRFGGAATVTSADTDSLSGVAVKGIFAGEWKWFGVGAGGVAGSSQALPGLYLRAGQLRSFHLRAEVPDLSLPVSSTGVGRVGLAYNEAGDGGVGFFLGIPLCYTACHYSEGGVRGDLRVPLSSHFDVALSGFTHSNEGSDRRNKFWGVAIAGQIRK